MKLNKQFKNVKYQLWIVVAVYMQAIDLNCERSALLLVLATRMMDKAVIDGVVGDFEGNFKCRCIYNIFILAFHLKDVRFFKCKLALL